MKKEEIEKMAMYSARTEFDLYKSRDYNYVQGFIAGFEKCQEQQPAQSDAVEFLDWIQKNLSADDGIGLVGKTSQQMYEIFKKHNP
mgnify:CR=1 FL=1